MFFICKRIQKDPANLTYEESQSRFILLQRSSLISILHLTYEESHSRFILLQRSSQSLKTPSDGTCLREPPGGFCDVGCCCFLPHWRFLTFILALFHATGTPPRLLNFRSTYSELYPGYFRLLAFSPRVLRNFERHFLPQAFFTLHSFCRHIRTALWWR